MSSKRYNAHAKRSSNSFSIEALIAKDRKDDDPDESGNEPEVHRPEVERPEVDVERRDGAARRSGSGSASPRPSTHRDDDDDDDDRGPVRRSSEGRPDSLTPDYAHRHRPHPTQQHPHHYPHHLHQFQQLLTRPAVHSVVDSIHPLMRQNLLTAASSSRLDGADSVLRRAAGLAAGEPHPAGPYCCAPPPPIHGSAPPSCPGVVSQRPGGSRDDEMAPFYTWLLSRHGAFFGHRIHPAGKRQYYY